jgi:DNA-binding MarR family transcriptional regulator
LEENGFIKKKLDDQDKRLVKLFLTKKGKEKRDVAKEVVLRFNEKIYKEVPQEDLRTTFKVLSKVNEIIDENKIFN